MQIRVQRQRGDHVLHQGVLVRQAGGREGGDGVLAAGELALRVPHPSVADVRVHDQFHPEAETPARTIHDEQRAGELHRAAGETLGWDEASG